MKDPYRTYIDKEARKIRDDGSWGEVMRGREMVSRQAHNLKVAGSSPARAPKNEGKIDKNE